MAKIKMVRITLVRKISDGNYGIVILWNTLKVPNDYVQPEYSQNKEI